MSVTYKSPSCEKQSPWGTPISRTKPAYIHICVYVCMYLCKYVYISLWQAIRHTYFANKSCIHMYLYTCMCVYIYVYKLVRSKVRQSHLFREQNLHTYVHIYVYVCVREREREMTPILNEGWICFIHTHVCKYI
jgi:hypothetical protein